MDKIKKHIIKKYIGFLVFPLLLLMMFSPVGEAQAVTDITSKVKIDNLKITIASTGSETEGIHGSNDTSMKLKYSGKFSFPNVAANEIKDGDYFIVKAPDNLSLTDGSLDLIDSTSNIKMGTVRVDNANHRLVFTFSDKVKDKQNIRGDFVAEATETLQKEGKTVTYVLPDGKTQTITYKVNKYEQTDVIGETITKYGYNDNNKARAHFQMKINRAKKDMTGHVVKITDDVSKGAFANYVEGTFYMHEAEFETTNTNSSAIKRLGDEYEITTDPEVYKANSDKKALLTFVNGKRGFELLMPTNMGTKSFFLTYDTSSPADTSTISNSAQYLIDNQPQLIWEKYGGSIGTRTEATFNLKTVKSVGASVTADIAGKIKITKYDEADADVKLAGVVFEIREKTTNNLVGTVTTNADGIALSETLSDGKYIVKEKTPKSGYQVNSQEFEVEMKDGKGVPLNISNKRVTVDFEATKTWVNGKATDYKEVKLGLYVHKEGQTVADAKPVTGNYTPEVTVSNGVYTYKWKNQLPERDVDGSKLVYSVRELQDQTNLPLDETETVVGGTSDYVVSYNADKTKITNTYKPAKINVTAKKVWTGGNENIRPTVYFKLYRTPEGGAIEEVAGVEKKEVPKTDGTVEWTDLPATDEHGVKYTYSVMEVDEDGNLVTTVDGYTSEQTAELTVTNKYAVKPTSSSLEVTKKLIGRELKADEFEFTLTDQVGNVETAKNDANGKVKFKELTFDEVGTYTYKIAEKAGTATGIKYDTKIITATVTVADNGKGALEATIAYDGEKTFENTYTPEKRTIEGQKIWNDNNNQDGKRPDKIKVILNKTVDGKTSKVAEKEVTAKDNWSYEFTNLPKFEGGKEITYSIDEEGVEGYKKTIDGYNLKNSYTPEVVNVQGTKTWDDANNQDGKRPDKIKVILNKTVDGKTSKVAEKEVTAKDNWSYEFTNLPKFEGGKEITYSIDEEAVAGYTKAIDGYNLKNSYTPEVVNVQGTKTWDDANNQDGKRPDKIKVILNKTVDGKTTKVAEKEVTAKDNWNYAFNDLPKYENGKEIKYSIDEVDVPGYKKSIKGYNLENKYIPKKPGLPKTGSTPSEVGGLGVLGLLAGYVLIRRKNKAN